MPSRAPTPTSSSPICSKNLLPKNPNAVTAAELDAWLNQPGIPRRAMKAQSRGFSSVDTARIAWLGSKMPADSAGDLRVDHPAVGAFHRRPGEDLKPEQLKQLDDA